jgi:hypothetical protein
MENLRTSFRWLADTALVAGRVMMGAYPSTHAIPIRSFLEGVHGRGDVPVGLADAREVTRLYETVTSKIPAR